MIRFFIFLPLLFSYAQQTLAAPSGTDLMTACEYSLQNDFHGIEGQICSWYVTPCDCNPRDGQNIPRVCLPSSLAVESLAQEVIDGLKKQPQLLTKDAALAAALILSVNYPCKIMDK